MKILDILLMAMLVVGGLNWGIIGIMNLNLVSILFGELSLVSRLFYICVGASAIYQTLQWNIMKERWT
jgi:uncharacterized membrane protein YuzA (DUF378 family)